MTQIFLFQSIKLNSIGVTVINREDLRNKPSLPLSSALPPTGNLKVTFLRRDVTVVRSYISHIL